MSEIQDSAAIIAADMRQLADDIEAGRAIVGQSVWRSYADRVEAIGTAGNIAKLREAMRLVSRVAVQMTRGTITGEAPTRKEVDDWAMRLCDIIDDTLATPARNCNTETNAKTSETITVKRSECAVLSLVLKRKWYDMIASREKREEYRDATQYWRKRIEKWDLRGNYHHIVEFRCGYKKDAPCMAFSAMAVIFGRIRWFGERTIPEHPEWGEPQVPHFVLIPGSRVKFADDKEGGAK